jgi:hypothetical protein
MSYTRPVRRSEIAVEMGLSPTGGHSLGIVSDAIDEALRAFHASAVKLHDPETAAVLLAMLLMRDPSYKPRPWVAEELRPHKAAVVSAICKNDAAPLTHEPWRNNNRTWGDV